MEGFIEEAHEDMIGLPPEASDHAKAAYLDRWRQREAMYRGLSDYVAQCNAERTRILEEIKEREDKQNQPNARVMEEDIFVNWPIV